MNNHNSTVKFRNNELPVLPKNQVFSQPQPQTQPLLEIDEKIKD